MRAEFLDFYERDRPRVERFLMLLGASRQDAEDAAQEAFADGWQLVTEGRWQPRISNPRAWVRKVALRCYNRPRGPRRRVLTDATVLHEFSVPGDPGHAELTDQTLAVLQALAMVSDEQARMAIALEIDGFDTLESAQVLGLGVQRVRDLRKKARAHLKAHLAPAPEARKEEKSR